MFQTTLILIFSTTNLSEMSKDVKMIAALMDDDLQGENLLDAARNLCAAFYDLLKAAEPETKEVIYISEYCFL